MPAQGAETRRWLIAFPPPGLVLPGCTPGRNCSWSPPTDLLMPILLSLGFKSVSQTWDSGNTVATKNLLHWTSSCLGCLQLRDPCWPHWEAAGLPVYLVWPLQRTGHPKFWLVNKSLVSLTRGLTHPTDVWCHNQGPFLQPCPFPLGLPR